MENKLWYYRNQKALTLQELSKLSGLSVAALNKIENGNTQDILLSNAIILSRILNVDIYDIDTNVGNMDEVHKIVTDNIEKYPNAKWELYPMIINN